MLPLEADQLNMRGLGLCPFSGLVCDLLPRRLLFFWFVKKKIR